MGKPNIVSYETSPVKAAILVKTGSYRRRKTVERRQQGVWRYP